MVPPSRLRPAAPPVPAIGWPTTDRGLLSADCPKPFARAQEPPKCEAGLPRLDVSDEVILAALQAAGTTNAASLSLALAVSRSTLWRRLRALEQAGRVLSVAGRWQIA